MNAPRVLCVSHPGVGHVAPVLPVARALVDAGAHVRFAVAAGFGDTVRAAGFDVVPAGLDWSEARAADTFAELATMPAWQRGTFLLRDVFADRAAHATARDVVRIIDTWQPDLVVVTDYEYGGAIAAEARGVRCATVGVALPTVAELMARLIRDERAYLRSAHGLDPFAPNPPGPYVTYAPAEVVPDAHRLIRARPPRASLRDGPGSMPPLQHARSEPRSSPDSRSAAEHSTAHPRSDAQSGTSEPVLSEEQRGTRAPLGALPGERFVYVSLGTVFNERPEVFLDVLAGLRDVGRPVVATVGRDLDPARLGRQPDHVLVTRYLPQEQVLARADLFVTHSPFYSAMTALGLGVPLLMVPLSADQPAHAEHFVRLGVGRALRTADLPTDLLPEAAPLSAEAVQEAARALLASGPERERSAQMAAACTALPTVDEAARALLAGVPVAP